jgi:hypothetical protein
VPTSSPDLDALIVLAALRTRARLEAGIPPGRCLRCKDRGAIALSYIGMDMPPEGDPSPCVFGWAPHSIEIEFVTRPLPRRKRTARPRRGPNRRADKAVGCHHDRRPPRLTQNGPELGDPIGAV